MRGVNPVGANPCVFLRGSITPLAVEQTKNSLYTPFCLSYACYIVGKKIERQYQWLDSLRLRYPKKRYKLTEVMTQLQEQHIQLPEVSCLESLRGHEGAAASCYFSGLRAVVPESFGFNERNRRPPRDPFNALLSLTYTLVHAETALALHAAGLDPSIGYYHQISNARESLACDVMEAIRPLADAVCLNMVSSQTIKSTHFSMSETGCFLGKAGRTLYYGVYEEHMPTLRQAIREEVKILAHKIAPDMPEPSTYIPPWIASPYDNTPPDEEKESS